MKNLMKNYKKTLFYTLIAVLIGILVGTIDAIFGRVLLAITDFRTDYTSFLLPFLSVCGLLIVFLYFTYSATSLKGMALVFDAAHVQTTIPKRLVPLVMVTTWLTHLFGGSAGREGVAVQIGATVSHTLGKKLDTKGNPRIYLIIGMAAGFAGLFQTPLAATFFALEVLVAGALIYEALLPCLAASFTACYTSHFLGLEKFSVDLSDTISLTAQTAWKLVIIAILFGIVGGLFACFLRIAKTKLTDLFTNPYLRIFLMGAVLSGVFLLLHHGRYSGLGTNLIQASFSNGTIYPYDFAFKFVLTIATLAAGYQGGEVTPLFSIGAALGILLASIFGLPGMLIAALGYAAVFGSATNTLLAPILIGIEVFGPKNAIYFVIVCAIAYVCNGNQTIYGKQRKSSL